MDSCAVGADTVRMAWRGKGVRMQQAHPTPAARSGRGHWVRVVIGWAVLVIAVLSTLATAYRVEDVRIETENPGLGWAVTGVVALLAAAAWIAGLVLVQMTGRVRPFCLPRHSRS